MLSKIPFFLLAQMPERPAKFLLTNWDIPPLCVIVSVIAMSHFKGLMRADGWSTTREGAVVKIPINEGQRYMTWSSSGLYLPMALAVCGNCIPSELGCGSVHSVSVEKLHFPLTDLGSRPWAHSSLLLVRDDEFTISLRTSKNSWNLNWLYFSWPKLRGCLRLFHTAQFSVDFLPLVVVRFLIMFQLLPGGQQVGSYSLVLNYLPNFGPSEMAHSNLGDTAVQ